MADLFTGPVDDCFSGMHVGGSGAYVPDSKPIGQVVCYISTDAAHYGWTVDSASFIVVAVVSGTDAPSAITWRTASGNWPPTP